MRAAIVSLTDPDGPPHGGTIRVRSLRDHLIQQGICVDNYFPGMTESDGDERREPRSVKISAGESLRTTRLGILKKKYLPMPTQIGARNNDLRSLIRAGPSYDFVITTALSQRRLLAGIAPVNWLDMLDVWSQFCAREAQNRIGLARASARAQYHLIRYQEAVALSESDIVTAVGWRDTVELFERTENPYFLPVSFSEESIRRPRRLEGVQTGAVGFIGNFNYWPNVDAYSAMLKTWVPSLAAVGMKVLVAGYGSDNLPPDPNVELLGQIEDTSAFYNSVDATLAPIRLGGGVKVKVLESILHGIPSIVTPEAAEGLHPNIRPATLQRSTDQGLGDIKFDELQVNAINVDTKMYSHSAASDTIATIISDIERRIG